MALEAMRTRDIATWELDAAQRSALAAGHTVETHFSVNDFQKSTSIWCVPATLTPWNGPCVGHSSLPRFQPSVQLACRWQSAPLAALGFLLATPQRL